MNFNSLQANARQGDRLAEEQLFQYLSRSFALFAQQRIWNEEDCREVVQDALATIVKKYRELEVQTSFAGWAYAVLNNKILDYVKLRTGRARLGDELSNPARWLGQAEVDATLKTRLLDCLRRVCQAQPDAARALNLHYQGYKAAEVCAHMKLSAGKFYRLLSRARLLMTRCLETGGLD